MAGRVVIVGAGPAGLAVAATLGRLGVPYAVLERAPSVGAAWRSRYDGLRLHTVRWLSGLPGARIPRRYGRWVRRDDLVAYLERYAHGFGVRPEFGVEVTRVDRAGTGWLLETSAGAREAVAVVLATGYSRTPYLPDWPGRDTFPGPLIHSSDYRRPADYSGCRVLVVGAGNSAAEIALELSRLVTAERASAGREESGRSRVIQASPAPAGGGQPALDHGSGGGTCAPSFRGSPTARVDLSVRTPPNIVRRDVFGVPSQLMGIALKRAPARLMNPMTAVLRRLTVPDLSAHGLPPPPGDGFTQFLRTRTVPILDHGFVAAVAASRITVVAPVERFDGSLARLVDGTARPVDAVIAATGYRPDLATLVQHLEALDETGMPKVQGASTLPHAPRLYFVGISVELAGLLREIGREAQAVGRAIAGDLAGGAA